MSALMMAWALVATGATAAAAVRLRAVREDAARASHEVRGPLTAAQLALDGIAFRGELSPERVVALETQLRRARLALDELTGHGGDDALELTPAAAIVVQLAMTWRPVFAARGRAVRVIGTPPAGALWVDRTRLAQALGNLMANALEHGAGDVELRARAAGGRLRLEVCDGGPGLPAPVAALAGRPRAGRGARGRGLAIASGIAERHGGRLTAAPSPAGAALVLDLPLLQAGRATGEETS